MGACRRGFAGAIQNGRGVACQVTDRDIDLGEGHPKLRHTSSVPSAGPWRTGVR